MTDRALFQTPERRPPQVDFSDYILCGNTVEEPFCRLEAAQAPQPTPQERTAAALNQFEMAARNATPQQRDRLFQNLVTELRQIGQPAIDLLIDRVNQGNFAQRTLAMQALVGIGAPALEALQRTAQNPPNEETRRRLNMVIDQIQRQAPDGLAQELRQSVQNEGDLNRVRPRQIMDMLARCGTHASAALYGIADDQNAPPALRRFARTRLDELAQQNPGTPLLDSRGRMRRLGNDFQANYQGNELLSLSGPNTEIVRTGPGTYRMTQFDPRTGQRTETNLQNVQNIQATAEQYLDQFGNPQQRINVGVVYPNNVGTFLLYLPERRPAQRRQP